MLIDCNIGELTEMLDRFQAIANQIKEKDDELITNEFRADFLGRIEDIESICQHLNLDLLHYPANLKAKLRNPDKFNNKLYVFWHDLRNRVRDEILTHSFFYIPAAYKDYYDQEALFGNIVCEKFPSAGYDIKSAGNCYATGNYTACVFHLMRVAEIGAKAMVRAMKAERFIGNNTEVYGVKKFKKKPLELCDWKTLIDGLKKALAELEKGSAKSIKRKATFSYYNHAISQFSFFKDAWRNNISHGHDLAPDRKFYLVGETKDIMDNTKHFMQHLAQRVKE